MTYRGYIFSFLPNYIKLCSEDHRTLSVIQWVMWNAVRGEKEIKDREKCGKTKFTPCEDKHTTIDGNLVSGPPTHPSNSVEISRGDKRIN
jgi:hypothetical protein